ncbi:DUF4142 domain-containing protein [Pararhizobium mangrovi]|nr:DUF4142 domain-containing protein [Pararhizobium mangrovi]
MKRQFIVAALALTMTAPLAVAQSSNDTMSNGTMSDSSSSMAKVTDASKFVPMAAQANMTEIQMAKVALKMSDDADVKQFANRMIADHTKAGKGLKSAVKASDADLSVPSSLDKTHQAMVDKLENASSGQFNQMYIDANVKAHEQAVALFQGFATDGKAGPVKDFAQKTLPTLKEHLQMAEKLNQSA